MEEEACTDVLSLVQRCASSMDGVVSQSGSLSLEAGANPLVSPQVGFVWHPSAAASNFSGLRMVKRTVFYAKLWCNGWWDV